MPGKKPSQGKPAARKTAKAVAKKKPAESKAPDFPVAGLGASAGGLEALEELLNAMPSDTGIAFVVVTHQHPGHTSMLPELLAKETEMPVAVAEDGIRIKPDHVYVGPPGGQLTIRNGTLHRTGTEKKEAPRLPIDSFFRSLAEDQKERAIGIILSGTGSDGTLGLKAIKAESGMAMVEDPQSAKYAGMPSSAIATGLADYILAPAEMPPRLLAYATGPYLQGSDVTEGAPTVDAEPLEQIFGLLCTRTGHDFSSYKTNTLRRRIERRMNVHQIPKSAQYVRYLQENPHEIDLLFKELLISVTSFFRDPEAWDSLRDLLEELIASRPDDYCLRVWVPGCATGEEAFSIAILLHECMEKLKRRLEVQVFGTDLDAEAVETARFGQYPEGIGEDIPAERLQRYFIHDDGTYRISREIRDMTIFAPQNVIKDPPFTKLDLISCRNLLIYLNAGLQKKLLPVFHYALKPGGLLFLGPSETIGLFTEMFTPVDRRWKLFRRRETAVALHGLPEMPGRPPTGHRAGLPPKLAAEAVKEAHVSSVIERVLLNRFTPASVVVNDRGDIIHIQGRTGMFLEPSEGEPRANILEMAREGLQMELAGAMRRCAAKGGEVVRDDVRVKTNGDYTAITLSVTKLQDPETIRGLLLVSFRLTPPAAPEEEEEARKKRQAAGKDGRSSQLEQELQFLKESHQTILEELETSNEELKSTNEELQSTNEELQSTNEELETSKEEMQSLNEELTTLNAELQSKVEDLSQANDDMQNLLNSTDIATVFLDDQLNINRYTEQTKELIMLRPTDLGRPISELASNLEFDDLVGVCREVLKTLVFKECEVRATNGSWFLMRIMPYRTSEDVIDGLVLTFVGIDQLKSAKEIDGRERAYFESIYNTVRNPLVVLDDELRIVSCNTSFYTTFQTNQKQTEGEQIFELGAGQWDVPELRKLLEEILPKEKQLANYRISSQFPKIGKKSFLLNARRLEQESGVEGKILLVMEELPEG